MQRLASSRLIQSHRSLIALTNQTDAEEFKMMVKKTSNVPDVRGYAIGPETVTSLGARRAVGLVAETHPDAVTIYWGSALENDGRFNTGCPIYPGRMYHVASAGFSAVMGYLSKDSVDITIGLAQETGVRIIFAGKSLDGYLTAARYGINDFLVGSAGDHVRMLSKMAPYNTSFWVLAPANQHATIHLTRELRDRPMHLITTLLHSYNAP